MKNFEGYVAADLTSNPEIVYACEKYSKDKEEPLVEEKLPLVSKNINEKRNFLI